MYLRMKDNIPVANILFVDENVILQIKQKLLFLLHSFLPTFAMPLGCFKTLVDRLFHYCVGEKVEVHKKYLCTILI